MAIELANKLTVEVHCDKSSFWELIEQYCIKVPQLQRDYAYGRDVTIDNVKTDKVYFSGNESTKIIRESLVRGAKDALTNQKNLNLNFIYGSEHEVRKYSPIDGRRRTTLLYSPIDGQQRLTTLFLLYWYVFQRVNDSVSLSLMRDRFSYATRDTSERFIKNISQNLFLDFSAARIKDQIQDFPWFADTFCKDPTVWSMLVVMDSIHEVFKDATDAEMKDYATKLRDKQPCPVEIEVLTVTSLGNEEDLYIKVNGRGKQLSDFEVFKSLLQKSEEIKCIIGGTPSLSDISEFIGRFNTEYSKLFNTVIGNPLIVEDALFAFLRNYLMCRYFSQVSRDGVSEDEYREECGKFRYYNGKVLFEFFTNPDYFGYYTNPGRNCPYDVNNDSVRDAVEVLSRMNSYYSLNGEVDAGSDYFSIADRIKKLTEERSMYDDFIDYAIFEYILKFGYPKSDDEKNAFSMWKRFVFNISSNVDLKGSNESLVKILRVFSDTIRGISLCSEEEVLKGIKSANDNVLLANVTLMKPHFDEESTKAGLILTDQLWKADLISAEGYYIGGQIGFLLNMSYTKPGGYNRTAFIKLFNASKKVWNSDKRVLVSVDSSKVTKALLCVKDLTSKHTSHLIRKNADTYEIPLEDYGEVLQNYTDKNKDDRCAQWEIVKTLLEKVSNGKSLDDAADELILCRTPLEYWKECFVSGELFGCSIGQGIPFSNHVCLVENDVLLLSRQSVRSKNMSLRTLMLYLEMRSNGMNGRLNTWPTLATLDDKGNPYRFIDYKKKSIGYNNKTSKYVINPDGITKDDVASIMTEIRKL